MSQKNLSTVSLIKKPVFTKKTMRLIDLNQYTFEVDVKITKPVLKQLIEKLFNVDVRKINIIKKKSGKRAIITLKDNQKLPIFLDK